MNKESAMPYKVCITNSDGRHVDWHFGQCSDFTIAEVDGMTGRWKIVGHRFAQRACNGFSHTEKHVNDTARLLSDCRFLLIYRIGIYPRDIFEGMGIECFESSAEEPVTIDHMMAYIKA